jgi:hypothetical protein
MKRIEVTSCGGCPFSHEDNEGERCDIDEPNRRRASFYGDTPRLTRPDWCPLDAGPVVVMSPTADGKVRGSPAMTYRGRLQRTCESCPSVRACYGAKRCEGAPGTEADLSIDPPMVQVLVHADGGACHGKPVVNGRCTGCGIVPDMQSTELWVEPKS